VIAVEKLSDLIELAQFGTLEIHVRGSRLGRRGRRSARLGRNCETSLSLVGRLAPATVTVVAFDRPKLMITLATTCEQGKM
jgi:hypothetical protein